MSNRNTSPEMLQQEIIELQKQIEQYKEEARKAEELRNSQFNEILKQLPLKQSAQKEKITAMIFMLLIFVLLFFAIAFEIFSSRDLRNRQREMVESIENSNNRINLLSSYISVLDENLQIIPDILKKNFGQVNQYASSQIREFENFSAKSLESLEKVNEIGEKSKQLMSDLSQIDNKSEQSIGKMETLETKLESKSSEQITKIEKIQERADENRQKVSVLVNQEQMDKILTFMNKYKVTFNTYRSKNDVSLLYKMVIVDEIGNVPYTVIIDAFRKYKFRNFEAPDIATLQEWDQNMIDLCNNAIQYLKAERDPLEPVSNRDRYFNDFKADEDYTNYKRWGYFNETANYADLITFYQNTLNSVQNRILFNKQLAEK